MTVPDGQRSHDPDIVKAAVQELLSEALLRLAMDQYHQRCADAGTDPAAVIEWNLRILAEEIAYRVPFSPEMNVLESHDAQLFAKWKSLGETESE